MLEEIVSIIRENNRIPEDVVIDRESKLDTDIGLSSYDLMEVLVAAEDKYGVEIPREKIPEFTTLGDVLDCLEEVCAKKGETA